MRLMDNDLDEILLKPPFRWGAVALFLKKADI